MKRRVFMKSAAAGERVCRIEGAQGLFTAKHVRSQASVRRVLPWLNRRLLDLLGVDDPIIQAPMAGPPGAEMPVAVLGAGGLRSLPCALLTPEQVRKEVAKIRARTQRPIPCEAPQDSADLTS
jgi:hypothetical protein